MNPVHHLAGQVDAQPPDLSFLQGGLDVGVRGRQRVEGLTVVRNLNGHPRGGREGFHLNHARRAVPIGIFHDIEGYLFHGQNPALGFPLGKTHIPGGVVNPLARSLAPTPGKPPRFSACPPPTILEKGLLEPVPADQKIEDGIKTGHLEDFLHLGFEAGQHQAAFV